MSWFFIALAGPILWAIVNHIDKYLLSDNSEGSNIGALMIFSTATCGLVLPVFYLINRNIFTVSPHDILYLIIIGAISVFAIMPYMYAIEEEEASIVIPLFQLIPIWGYFLSYFFLGETLNWTQLVGAIFIIFGSIVITIEEDIDEKIKFKGKVILLMLISTVLFAVYETLFKFVALDTSFILASFWEYLGLFIVGLLFFVFIKNYRESFLRLIKLKGKKILSLNIVGEALNTIGSVAVNFSLLIAPVALVLTVSGVQPLFVFIFGLLLTIFYPKIYSERIVAKHLIQKIISILVIVIGSMLII